VRHARFDDEEKRFLAGVFADERERVGQVLFERHRTALDIALELGVERRWDIHALAGAQRRVAGGAEGATERVAGGVGLRRPRLRPMEQAAPRVELRARRCADRRPIRTGDISVAENGTALRKAIEVRRFQIRMAKVAEGIRTMIVGYDDDHIWPGWSRSRCDGAGEGSRKDRRGEVEGLHGME